MNSFSTLPGVKRRLALSLVGTTMLSGLMASPAFAAGTLAGTEIKNTAQATYTDPGTGTTSAPIDSNEVTMQVDELLNVTTASTDAGPIPVSAGGSGYVTTFQVTNTGNGPEAFVLAATGAGIGGDQFDPSVTQIVIDDGDGIYEPGIDVVYTPGSDTPILNPDQSLTVFVISSIPSNANDGNTGNVELTATASTGSGAPGTTFPGDGYLGSDAVVGSTTASATDAGTYQVQKATVTLLKSQSVVDPWGRVDTVTVPGSIITYTIVATVSGSGTLNGLKITDVVPAGTTYVSSPPSITYEGVPQTDAVDGDQGSITGATVLGDAGPIVLGSTPTTVTRTLTFKVKVN